MDRKKEILFIGIILVMKSKGTVLRRGWVPALYVELIPLFGILFF